MKKKKHINSIIQSGVMRHNNNTRSDGISQVVAVVFIFPETILLPSNVILKILLLSYLGSRAHASCEIA